MLMPSIFGENLFDDFDNFFNDDFFHIDHLDLVYHMTFKM